VKEELREYIQNNRRDFQNEELDELSAPENPFKLFEKWFEELLKSEVLDPYAFTLATSGADNQPSARVLYMRDVTEKGITCYTNYNSQKGKDLEENPRFCANFFWPELARQVRFEGIAQKVDTSNSDDYFNSRPRESKVGAWASNQSTELVSRRELENKVMKFTEKFDGQEVPRPPHWGGYLLMPEKIEFWQGRESRLHDRLRYKKIGDGKWQLNRLSP
jgi:pyridoxamine 5'-phosphate oxidase